MNLDPKPYYVVEVDDSELDHDGRYSYDFVIEDSADGDHGGNYWNLAQWRPREGFEQDMGEYYADWKARIDHD